MNKQPVFIFTIAVFVALIYTKKSIAVFSTGEEPMNDGRNNFKISKFFPFYGASKADSRR